MIKEISSLDLELFGDVNVGGDSPFRKYIGYFVDDEIVGYLIYDVIYDRCEIVNIFINYEYRNRKFGTNMLKYLIDFGKKNNFYNITLEVRKDNLYAIRLYENMGFSSVAVRSGYYDGVDGILMELIL